MAMNELPKDPQTIRARLRRYERKLREEKRTHGLHGDGAGKRYFVGPLYLLLGDVDGALESFRWFETEFPDDAGEPGQYLCWTLTLHRSGDLEAAARKLRETMLQNLYLIPRLLALEVSELDIWHGSSDEWSSYLDYIPKEYFALWDEKEFDWASRLHHGPEFQSVLARYVEIQGELNHLPPGPRRSRLVHEAHGLKR
ncbi:MAG TPA: hypothetical protein QGH10_18700 [Armatimonadota bacterium]|nr:hypothetical protein [Armatimonadota bacterium]